MASEVVPYSLAPTRSRAGASLNSVALVAIGILAWLHPVGEGLQVDLLLVATALLGAPHGVYDLPLLLAASGGRGGVLIGLTALYLALIAATAVGWMTFPAATLILFLCMAVAHFGEDFAGPGQERSAVRAMQWLAGGLCVILPLLCLHPASVAPWVAAIAGVYPSSAAELLARVAPAALGLWIVSTGASLVVTLRRAAWRQAIDLAAVVALFALAPPLVAFAAYFALSHSLRHVLEADAAGVRGWTEKIVWLAPAVVVSTGAVFVLGRIGGEAFAVVSSLRLLAALATPHLLLGPWLRGRAAGRRPARGVSVA